MTVANGPLQDSSDLTPDDLHWAGIAIEEPVPNYYRFRCVDDGTLGALHDTPKQAIASARRYFGIYPEEE